VLRSYGFLALYMTVVIGFIFGVQVMRVAISHFQEPDVEVVAVESDGAASNSTTRGLLLQQTTLSVAPSVVSTLFIFIFGFIYNKIAFVLTDWENHRTLDESVTILVFGAPSCVVCSGCHCPNRG
jgi:hypothetical protein